MISLFACVYLGLKYDKYCTTVPSTMSHLNTTVPGTAVYLLRVESLRIVRPWSRDKPKSQIRKNRWFVYHGDHSLPVTSDNTDCRGR